MSLVVLRERVGTLRYVAYPANFPEYHSDIRAVAVCARVWAVYRALGVGGVGVDRFRALWDSGVMKIRNTRKGFDRINRI